MTRQDDTDQRLTRLEIKASYSEDLLDTLNEIVTLQQQHIDQLRREVNLLRQQATDSGPAPFRSLADELPPHY
jgi:SlyX protein